MRSLASPVNLATKANRVSQRGHQWCSTTVLVCDDSRAKFSQDDYRPILEADFCRNTSLVHCAIVTQPPSRTNFLATFRCFSVHSSFVSQQGKRRSQPNPLLQFFILVLCCRLLPVGDCGSANKPKVTTYCGSSQWSSPCEKNNEGERFEVLMECAEEVKQDGNDNDCA